MVSPDYVAEKRGKTVEEILNKWMKNGSKTNN